ncbi:amino acid ABC transporter permease [Streptomyces sp. ID05-04B]|uniref:amino acid ABC transporter permease n=1 Tax=Streptomyces sp. ID05-04B TaxID=3028661 RepID=UPI0029C2BD27|nr:amino acid ABC transporter permease [Streptomyces sp. ID05-04B]MDX5567113.1 amino acid ABC transporter permease [Streptomyces sp. ID05-04B]
MAWDEWEQVKAAAAERHSTHMQLNQLLADQGGGAPTGGTKSGSDGGSGTLRHSNGPWTHAAGTSNELKISTESTRTSLQSGHTGVSTGAVGLGSLAALKTVLTTWEKRLEAVRDECESLEPKLRAVAKDMGELDSAVAAKARAVPVSGGGKDQ